MPVNKCFSISIIPFYGDLQYCSSELDETSKVKALFFHRQARSTVLERILVGEAARRIGPIMGLSGRTSLAPNSSDTLTFGNHDRGEQRQLVTPAVHQMLNASPQSTERSRHE